jgi:Virulence factor BrkB
MARRGNQATNNRRSGDFDPIRRDCRPAGAYGKPGTFGVLRRTVSEFSEDNLTDWAAALTYLWAFGDLPCPDRPGLDRGAIRRSAIDGEDDHGHRHPNRSWLTPGGIVAVVVWLIASAAFAVYVANFGSYDKTYGPPAGSS